MKKMLYLFLFALLVVFMVSCDGGEPAPGETVEITFWHSMDGAFGELVNDQITLFNETVGEEKNIIVTGVFQSWPGTDALTAAMRTDDVSNMPDVIQLYSESVALVRDWRRTVWVEDYLEAGKSTIAKEDLIQNAIGTYSIDDRMIGMPYTISALMLYYNKTQFAQAGYTEPPTTIAEMASMLNKLADDTDADYGLNVRIDQYEFETYMSNQGPDGSKMGNNNNGHNGRMTEFIAGDNGILDAFLTEWQKVIDTGAYKFTRDAINNEFAAGMHSMVIMTSSRILTIKNLVGDDFEWDLAPVPKVNEDDIGGAYSSGSGLYMLDRNNRAKKAAAWEFVQFMASPQAQVIWSGGTGYVPVNINTQDLPEYQAAIAAEPRLQRPYNVLSASSMNTIPSFAPNSSTINSVIRNTMIAFANGTLTKEQAHAALVEGIQDALDDFYRVN